MKVVSLWLAIDESTKENGCMRVIPGSHRDELSELIARGDVPNVLGSAMDEEGLNGKRAVDVDLQPGDVSVHHPNLGHGSRANRSARRRCGLTIRYIPTCRQILDAQRAAPFLLRGGPVANVNDYLPWPSFIESQHHPFRGCRGWIGEPTRAPQ